MEIELDDELFAALSVKAQSEGKTLSELAVEGMSRMLAGETYSASNAESETER